MSKILKIAMAGLGAGVALTALASASNEATRRRRLAGQVVLITGGSRGFGLAMARAFGKLGCRIALCARDEEELSRAKAALAAKNCDAFTVRCDVADKHSVDPMVQKVIDHYGRIDILINNAGEIIVSPLGNLDLAEFERSMAVMFWGTVHTTLAVLPAMKERHSGRIVNITSIGGKVSVPHLLSYSCAKAAAVAFSDGLRHEVKQFGVGITTIIPGLMRTGSHVNALFKGRREAESSWFGVAASLPLLTLSAEQAAQMTVDAVCAGKAEKVLGTPAQMLTTVQTLLPNLTSEILRFANSLLPKAAPESSMQSGLTLESAHGMLYHLLTTLGRAAGRRLNQPSQTSQANA